MHIILIALSVAFTTNTEPKWELIDNQDGITTYKRSVPNSGLFAFRGEAEVRGVDFHRLLTLVAKPKYHPQWMDMCYMSKELKRPSPLERVCYTRFELPSVISWVVDDRDFVYNIRGEVKDNGNTFRAHFNSGSVNRSRPDKCCVRGLLKDAFIELKRHRYGRISMVLEAVIDPKGLVPQWVVYFVQKHWPFKSLRDLRKAARDKSVVIDPEIVRILQPGD